MVKTKGVTLVALATLLAGFVASCSSADAPSIDSIPSSGNTVTIEAEDDLPGLSSSPGSKDRAAPPSVSTEPTGTPDTASTTVPDPTATAVADATATIVPAPAPSATATPSEPAVMPVLDRPNIATRGDLYIGSVEVVIENNEPGSSLVYTLDGTEPSETNGIPYESPFEIGTTAPVTLKVIATREGFTDSDVAEAVFRVLPNFAESSEPIVLSGDDVLEISDTHFLHRGDITLSGNAKLIITDSVIEHVKDFAFEHKLVATENAEVIINNSGIGSTCTGSFNWAFFDNSRLTVNGMDPTHTQCNTWNFMSGSSVIDVTGWETSSGTVCDQTSVEIRDSHRMEIELCMPWPTVMDTTLPLEFDEYIFDPGDNSTMEFALSMFDSSVEGWGINVGPGSDITIRDTPSITVGVGIGLPSQNETMTAENIRSGHWEDQTFEFGVGAKLRLVNTYTYGWELNAWGGNTLVIRNSDYSGSSVNSSNSKYIIENTTADLLVAFEEVEMTVINSVITGDVVANDNTVITLIDSIVGDESDPDRATNVYAYGNGKVILRNTTVLGEQTTDGNGEIIVE